jgi:hypothetical protein
MVMVANNTFKARRSMMMVVKTYDMEGKENLLTQVFADVNATTVKKYFSIKGTVDKLAAKEGVFLSLQLLDESKKVITDNTYWIPDSKGGFSGLQKMKAEELSVKAKYIKPGRVEVTLVNKENSVLAFFNRIALVDADSKTRVLPAFYSDNYVTVLPGEEKKLVIDYNVPAFKKKLEVSINGWNASNVPQTISIDE